MLLLGVVVSVNAVAAAGSATLVLSGVVPDRGYTVDGRTITPNEDTELKVFVANYQQASRGPASENSTPSKWTELTGPKLLTASSYVKVVAP
jgi:hypothetical protein